MRCSHDETMTSCLRDLIRMNSRSSCRSACHLAYLKDPNASSWRSILSNFVSHQNSRLTWRRASCAASRDQGSSVNLIQKCHLWLDVPDHASGQGSQWWNQLSMQLCHRRLNSNPIVQVVATLMWIFLLHVKSANEAQRKSKRMSREQRTSHVDFKI